LREGSQRQPEGGAGAEPHGYSGEPDSGGSMEPVARPKIKNPNLTIGI